MKNRALPVRGEHNIHQIFEICGIEIAVGVPGSEGSCHGGGGKGRGVVRGREQGGRKTLGELHAMMVVMKEGLGE